MTDALPFVLPTELGPWRDEIEAECGGCTAEELLNDHQTNGFNNALKAALISMCDTKVRLIARLHRQGRLADPAAIRHQRDEELRERLEKLPRFEPGKAGGLSSTELSGRLIIRAEALSIFEEADDAP